MEKASDSRVRLVRARPEHLPTIQKFYNETSLAGDIELQIRRSNPTLAYELLGPDHTTYLLLAEEGTIEAMATLVFRQGQLFGTEQVIGYATDLRVSSSRRAILSWSQHFLPILEEEKAARGCSYVLSVVSELQKQAYNAFIRPRLTRRHLPRYHLFRPFQLISIHGLLPWASRPLDSLNIRQGRNSDWDALAEYCSQKNRLRPSAFAVHPSDLISRWKAWPNLSPESFLLASDRSGRIVGCCATWDGSPLQELIVVDYHRRARVLHDSLNSLAWMRIGRRLADPGEALKFRYLTHMSANNPDIMQSLILQSYLQSERDEFIVYPHFAGDLLTAPARAWITGKIRAALYFVHPPRCDSS